MAQPGRENVRLDRRNLAAVPLLQVERGIACTFPLCCLLPSFRIAAEPRDLSREGRPVVRCRPLPVRRHTMLGDLGSHDRQASRQGLDLLMPSPVPATVGTATTLALAYQVAR